jgi:RHS repeat-associated protein
VLLASTGSTVNPHTYVGRERYYRMPNAAMYHLGFRDYAQGLGRFMTVDPVRRYWEHEAYAANNPTRRLDPRGLQSWIPGEGPNPEEMDGRQLPPPGGWPWTPELPPPGPYKIPPRVDPLPVTCGGERLPRALPVFPGLPPSGPGTGERDVPIGVQPIDWDWIAPWIPSDPNHPFHECMAKRNMSAQSPCWAHYIRNKFRDRFPDVDTGQDWRYTLERCLCEDACVCASRTCVSTPPGECGNVKDEYEKPPGLGRDQFPWPRG